MSPNGLLTFGSPIPNDSSPLPFPRLDPCTLTLPVSCVHSLIAPFWANVSFEERGSVFFRVASDKDNFGHFRRILDEVNSLYSAFEPTLQVVVTWFGVENGDDDVSIFFQPSSLYSYILVLITHIYILLLPSTALSPPPPPAPTP